MNIFGYNLTFQKREGSESSTTASGSTMTVSAGANWAERLLGSSNPDVAAKVSTVYQCIDLISSSLATMPLWFKIRDKKTGVMRRWDTYDPNKLNYLLNVRPNARMNSFDFKKQIYMWKLSEGNAFVLPVDPYNWHLDSYEDGIIDHLVLLKPNNVTYDIFRDEYTVEDAEQGVPRQVVPGRMIWHFKNTNFGFNSCYWGQSTIYYALSHVKMAATGDNEMLKRVASGGRGKYILNYENASTPFGTHNKDQMKGAANNLSNDLSTKDIITLPYKGLSVTPIAMNSADLKLLETAELSRKDICGFFHVPLYKIGQQSSNYKTPDAAETSYLNECLMPHCAQSENEIWSKFTNPSNWWKLSFDYDEDARQKLDVEMQIRKDQADLQSGITTINELRAKRGKMPVEGGDTTYITANVKSLAQMKEESQPAPQATTPPEDEQESNEEKGE